MATCPRRRTSAKPVKSREGGEASGTRGGAGDGAAGTRGGAGDLSLQRLPTQLL